MKSIRHIIYSAIMTLLFTVPSLQAQDTGIQFFDGTFEEALTKAQQEDKLLFVDFYAVWCGPCKRIAREVFPLKEVGDYFNSRFVSLQLDAEAPENVEIAKKYKVEAFPSLGFISKDGTLISMTVGSVNKETLLDAAKIVVGEVIGFADLYDMYRKDKSNLETQQSLLLQAPAFLAAQDGMDAERWVLRIQRLFKEYIHAKSANDALINRQDYMIINNLAGDDVELKAEIIDYMVANFDKWAEAVGPAVGYYIIEDNADHLTRMAKAGDRKYTERLERIRGEYKAAYDILPDTKVSEYDKLKSYYDALYGLYATKEVDSYISAMTAHLALIGKEARSTDYGQAAQELYYAAGDKLQPKHHEAAIKWIDQALTATDTNLVDRLNLIVMAGDSYKALKQYDQAQSKYNQCFIESAQLKDNEMLRATIQSVVVRKIAELDLLRK